MQPLLHEGSGGSLLGESSITGYQHGKEYHDVLRRHDPESPLTKNMVEHHQLEDPNFSMVMVERLVSE